MIMRLFNWYGEHVFIYSFVAGVPFMYFTAPGQDAIVIPLALGTLLCFGWFSINALVVCTDTAIRLKKEGKPLFEAGGLTEYDSEFARQVGEAAAKANRKLK